MRRLVTSVLTVLLVLLAAAPVTAATTDPLGPGLRAWLDEHGPVRVGWSRGIEPVVLWDGDDAVGGFGVGVWDLGAAELGIEVEHVPFDDIPSVVAALRDGTIDVAGTHAARPDLLEFAEMARPNAWERLVLVAAPDGVPPGGVPRAGETVTTVAGSPLEQGLAQAFPELTYVETATIPEGVAAVARGEIDYDYNGLSLLGWYSREAGFDLVPVGDAVTVLEIGSWATVGTEAAAVNRAVRDAVSPDELALLHTRWTGFDLGDPSLEGGLPAWSVAALASALGAVVLLGGFALLLRRRVALATAELRALNDELEQRVDARTHELAATASRLRRSNAALQRFSRSAAHDLRGPVTAIAGLADVAMRIEMPQDALTDLLSRVKSSSLRLSRMVEAMLRDAVEMGADTGSLDGPSFAAWLRELSAPELQVIDGRLDVQAPERLLDVDVEALRRAAVNLTGNATKYATNEEGTLVRVTLRRERDTWELTVEDNGPGIPEGLWAEVFDMGRRLEHDDRGFGMGLAAIRDIVQGAGGAIRVGHSEVLGGACFTVTLPIVHVVVPEARPPEHAVAVEVLVEER